MRSGRIWIAGALFATGLAWAGPVENAYQGADRELLAQVRSGFETAPQSAADTRALIGLMDNSLAGSPTEWPPIFRAFRATLDGLIGKHSFVPWEKYRRVKASLAGFAGLVEAHPDSSEVRMLRYSTCSQLPDFFGQRMQAEADLTALVALFEQGTDPMVPLRVQQRYVQWILLHGHPAPDIRARLEKLLAP